MRAKYNAVGAFPDIYDKVLFSFHIMYQLNGLKSHPPHQIVNILFQFVIVNNKLPILWGS